MSIARGCEGLMFVLCVFCGGNVAFLWALLSVVDLLVVCAHEFFPVYVVVEQVGTGRVGVEPFAAEAHEYLPPVVDVRRQYLAFGADAAQLAVERPASVSRLRGRCGAARGRRARPSGFRPSQPSSSHRTLSCRSRSMSRAGRGARSISARFSSSWRASSVFCFPSFYGSRRKVFYPGLCGAARRIFLSAPRLSVVVEFCLCSRGHISFLRFRACAVFSAVLHYTIAPPAA